LSVTIEENDYSKLDISDSQLLNDALQILNDPLALSQAIKEQYDLIA